MTKQRKRLVTMIYNSQRKHLELLCSVTLQNVLTTKLSNSNSDKLYLVDKLYRMYLQLSCQIVIVYLVDKLYRMYLQQLSCQIVIVCI